ncbi:MAG: hypothetical protein PHI88_01105 [Candidatus Pacebacteria bacterium]|nr:hypothetical protein [Candidatus Paceibacterota bacterium]
MIKEREIEDIKGNKKQIGCLSCAIQKGEVQSPGGSIAETKYFRAEQDYEYPIPGFVILASRRHFKSVDELTNEEREDFIYFLCKLRKAMREALGIEVVYLVQEEDTSSHFHVWLFPRYNWMEEKFGRKIESVKPIMEYARENLKTEGNIKKIEDAIGEMKKYYKKNFTLPKLKRRLSDIEDEISHQILISEACFNICKAIPIISGRGEDFLPYFYNLNFCKGIASLHSLLLSQSEDEITIKNYIGQRKNQFPTEDISKFEDELNSISDSFRSILPFSLRHKACAHLDIKFEHRDFTCAYIIPGKLNDYIAVIKRLKDSFFESSNHDKNDSFDNIRKQSEFLIETIKNNPTL